MRIERTLGPSYVNLFPYLNYINGLAISRCIYKLDSFMERIYREIEAQQKSVLYEIFERGRLKHLLDIPESDEPLNGSDSKNPYVNLMTRQLATSAALVLRRFADLNSDMSKTRFKIIYDNFIYEPCLRFNGSN